MRGVVGPLEGMCDGAREPRRVGVVVVVCSELVRTATTKQVAAEPGPALPLDASSTSLDVSAETPLAPSTILLLGARFPLACSLRHY